MSWNKNNRAHTSLCFFEIWNSKQTNTQFTAAGEWSTDFLIGFSQGESELLRAEQVKTHAQMLDSAFISLYRATYEKDFNFSLAIASISSVLSDKDKKLNDLGDIVDAAYKFYGEQL